MARSKTLHFANRDAWLAQRKQGIGASEVASVVGLNPWQTPYQLWRSKLGLDEPKAETFAMRVGHILEDAVAQFWYGETGKEIIKSTAVDFIIKNEEVAPHLQVSPDRLYWLTTDSRATANRGVLECKTTQRTIDGDNLPQHWFCQVQANLGVAQLKHGSLAWLIAGREFGYKDIQLVPDFFAWLNDECNRFWTDYVDGKKEPPALTASDVLLKFPTATEGKQIEATAEIFDVCASLREVKDEINELEKRRETLENRVKMAFLDAEVLTYKMKPIATYRAPKPSRRFDAKLFQADHPNEVAPYIKETQGARRFVLKME